MAPFGRVNFEIVRPAKPDLPIADVRLLDQQVSVAVEVGSARYCLKVGQSFGGIVEADKITHA